MASVNVIERVERSYVLTLSREEAEALLATTVMIGGISPHRALMDAIGIALEDASVAEREDFKEQFARRHGYRAAAD